jgi:RNA polymerase sigma factor (sigma-70 family)
MSSPNASEPPSGNGDGEENAPNFNFDEDNRYLKKIAREKISQAHQPLIEASDLVQEALVEAIRHQVLLQTMPRRTRLLWMRRVLLNRLTDLIRRMKTARRGGGHVIALDTGSPSLSHVDGLMDPAESPSKIVSKWEEEDRVNVAIQGLSETDRKIILARVFDRLDFTSIGQQFQLSPEAARKRYERALGRLTALLAPPQGEDPAADRPTHA